MLNRWSNQGPKKAISLPQVPCCIRSTEIPQKFLTLKSGLVSLEYLCVCPQGSKESRMGQKKVRQRKYSTLPVSFYLCVDPSGQGQRKLTYNVKWLKRESGACRDTEQEGFEKYNLGGGRRKLMSGSSRFRVSFCRGSVVSLQGARKGQEHKQSCKHISTLVFSQHWLRTCQDFGLAPGPEVSIK